MTPTNTIAAVSGWETQMTKQTTEVTIDPERLAKVTKLLAGGHSENDGARMCAMEAVAFIAREPWSARPECACPVIGAFMLAWNDGLNDEDRNRLLLPLIPRLVGSRGSAALANRRANMAADWYIRVQTPAWLRLAGLTKHADLLASFPEITDFTKCPPLMPALEDAARDAAWAAARDAAWAAARDAARAAAWDAARDAAWAAARDAAWAAARDAARAASRDAARDAAWAAAWAAARAATRDAARDATRDAARDAARIAAWAAARAAARAAAGDALKKTTVELQASALDLVERMLTETDPQDRTQ